MTVQQRLESGILHHEEGRLAEAEKIYRQILAEQADHVDANYNLGNLLMSQGRLADAAGAYQQAIRIKPDFAVAYDNLGVALRAMGQLEEAVACHQQAIGLKPELAGAATNLANALIALGHFDEAIAACRYAIRHNPTLVEAHATLGNAMQSVGRLDEAIASYRQAIGLNPNFARAHDNLILAMFSHPGCDAGAIYRELCVWRERHAEGLKKSIRPHINSREPTRRLRIGYVSADFYGHASAFFLHPVFRCHDQREVEVFCYSQGAFGDTVTEQMKAQVEHWRQIEQLSDAKAADLIRRDQIDILVDLKLHTADNRLLIFARKPAPVQVTWLGYPGSTGLDTVDYRLTDPYLDPAALDDEFYFERSIRLPDTFWCYDPLTSEPGVNSLPAQALGFVTFGCLNNFYKVNGNVRQLWSRVLKVVDRSRLMILCPEGSHRQLLLDEFGREGIDADRIELIARVRRPQYLELYHRVDVGLDTFPCNGHTTSLDSSWMGVPVITLAGKTVMGRAGVSQLTNLGMTELIAETPEQYVEIASGLARDLPRLAELRRSLRGRMQASPLMDASRFARNIEAAYRKMWREWCAKSARNEVE